MKTKFSISGVNSLPRFPLLKKIDLPREIRPNANIVALYIHIPFCKSICQFCMLRRGAKAVDGVPDEYVNLLIKELNLKSNLLDRSLVSAIYFGGGTPSMLSPIQFSTILDCIAKHYSFSSTCEITFEGEPQSLKNISLLSALKDNKVNRISFGVQTFNERIRALLGRTDSIADIYEAIDNVLNVGFVELNVDYMYNLPDFNLSFIEEEISTLLKLGVNSIDCHPLKYISVSTFMLKEIVSNQMKLPNSIDRIDSFNLIRNLLLSNNFNEQYVDQYSINKRHHSNVYMQHLYGLNNGEYVGFGTGARSHYGNYGYTNYQSLEKYKDSLVNQELPIDRIVWATLADNFISCFPKRNDTLFIADIMLTSNPSYYLEKLELLSNNNYVRNNGDSYSLTALGLSWYQNLQEFLLNQEQNNNHIENAIVRSKKFDQFSGYFDILGEVLIEP